MRVGEVRRGQQRGCRRRELPARHQPAHDAWTEGVAEGVAEPPDGEVPGKRRQPLLVGAEDAQLRRTLHPLRQTAPRQRRLVQQQQRRPRAPSRRRSWRGDVRGDGDEGEGEEEVPVRAVLLTTSR